MAGDREVFLQDEKLTEAIIRAVIKVHQTLGPGFVESVYQRALILELERRGLVVETELKLPVFYEGQQVGLHRLDILVEKRVIVEVKTVSELEKVHYAQVRSYLKAAGLRLGLLVNFALEKADFRRVSPRGV